MIAFIREYFAELIPFIGIATAATFIAIFYNVL